MTSFPFHDRIIELSTAPTLDALANKILELPEKTPTKYREVAEEVNTRIKNFVNENSKSFFRFDLPALKKIQHLLPADNYVRPELKKQVAQLRKTINSMVKLAKAEPDLSILPRPLTALCEQYCTMKDRLNLSLLKIDSIPESLAESIANAEMPEISAFVEEAKKRLESHPHIFKQMITKFFQYASPKTQSLFFRCITGIETSLLSTILSILPKRLTYLNIINCKGLRDLHLNLIVERFKNLQTLNLTQSHTCRYLECENIKVITKLSKLQNLSINSFYHIIFTILPEIHKMTELRSLNLSNNDQVFNKIPKIRRMPNLKFLDLSNNKPPSISLILKIVNLHLESLNLTYCFLEKISLTIALDASHIKSLNLSQNINLDDEVAGAITQEASCLQSLDVSDCPFLTDAGAIKIVNKLKNLIELKYSCNNKETEEEIEQILQERRNKLQDRTINKKRKRPV
jgi:hypothetical protein